jgi:hypothetical protein
MPGCLSDKDESEDVRVVSSGSLITETAEF